MSGGAASAGFFNCHGCDLLVRAPRGSTGKHPTCPRCGGTVHARKPNSIERTWALVITAIILYFPANLLPVMTVTSLGKQEPSTIISGVIHLLQHGMWPLALIVFVASVVVPTLKIGVLCFLLLSVQRRSSWRPLDRTRLYRITEIVGRWSMVDVFVVAILVALVQLGSLATIQAGTGAVYFGAVVVTTMMAAESFDPRLIWDRIGEDHA